MKITKSQLKEIIKEELGGLSGVRVYLVTDPDNVELGIYTSQELAEGAIQRALAGGHNVGYVSLGQPGQTAGAEDYVISELTLDRDEFR